MGAHARQYVDGRCHAATSQTGLKITIKTDGEWGRATLVRDRTSRYCRSHSREGSIL